MVNGVAEPPGAPAAAGPRPWAESGAVVMLADGSQTAVRARAVTGAMDSNCGRFGNNDIGRFDVNVDRIRRVDPTR